MIREAILIQVRLAHLAVYTEFELENIVSAKNTWQISREERAIAAMELCYRWYGKNELLPEMIWRMTFCDERPYPAGLTPPSQWYDAGLVRNRKAWGAKRAIACELTTPRPPSASGN